MPIWTVVGIMSAALIGLIILQIYWINKANLLNQQEFDHSVHRALHSVSERLERREATDIIEKNVQIKTTNTKIKSNSKVVLGVGLKDITVKRGFSSSGIVVEEIVEGGLAWQAGIREKDIITSINNKGISSFKDVKDALKSVKYGDDLNVTFKEAGQLATEAKPYFNSALVPSLAKYNYSFSNKMGIPFYRGLTNSMAGDLDNQIMNMLLNDTLVITHFDCDKDKILNTLTTHKASIFNAQQMMSNLLAEMFTDRETTFEKVCRLDIESIVQDEFRRAGLKAAPQWCVIDNYSRLVSNSKDFDAHRTLQYKTTLFEDNFFREPSYLAVYFPTGTKYKKALGSGSSVSALLFILTIIGCFYYAVSSLLNQKKISELKTDFINNMTHELKTPVSTIKLASDMMLDEQVPKTPDKIKRFMGIIRDENVRLGRQIEKVLQIAKIEKGEEKLNFEVLSVNGIVTDVVQHSMLKVEQANGQLKSELNANLDEISGDKVHVVNMISNILDNAIKYTPEKPEIFINTRNENGGIVVTVKDNGIGMSTEVQKRIFDKFYREPTGNLHNVKGFGLGLSYVKHMIEAHGGWISVKSKKNKGSLFELYFPQQNLTY